MIICIGYTKTHIFLTFAFRHHNCQYFGMTEWQ